MHKSESKSSCTAVFFCLLQHKATQATSLPPVAHYQVFLQAEPLSRLYNLSFHCSVYIFTIYRNFKFKSFAKVKCFSFNAP